MSPWIAWLIAAISTAAFVSLWFWEVRRILNDRKSTVDSAAGQLDAGDFLLAEDGVDFFRPDSHLRRKLCRRPQTDVCG